MTSLRDDFLVDNLKEKGKGRWAAVSDILILSLISHGSASNAEQVTCEFRVSKFCRLEILEIR